MSPQKRKFVNKRVTLKTVAESAGVSESTASMVLNEHPHAKRYSPRTRDRVVTVARELGYQPHFFASQLRWTRPRLIILILSSFREAFATQIAAAFEHYASTHGYRLVVSSLEDKEDPATFYRDILGGHGVAAMAVVGRNTTEKLPDELIVDLAEQGTDCVLVNRDLDHPSISRVLVDYRVGQRELAEYLYGQGIRQVLMLQGRTGDALGTQRWEVLQQVAREMNRPQPQLHYTQGPLPLDGYEAIRTLSSHTSSAMPEAVVTTDWLAYGVLRGLTEVGSRPGENIAVTGFDDLYPSVFMIPPLTTVRLPMEEMGEHSARLLIEMLEGRAAGGQSMTLPTRLVVRQSGVWAPRAAHQVSPDGPDGSASRPR